MKLKKLLLIGLLLISSLAQAKETITLIVGFPPGTGNDLAARQVAKDITEGGGPIVVVENKIGNGGNIAVMGAVKATVPTLLLHSNSLYLNSLVTKSMTLDLKTQLTPVAYIGSVPMVLETSKDSPIKSIEDIKSAKNNQLTYGSGGVGSLTHANMAYISYILSKPMTHIPYQGASRSLIDLGAGRLDLCFDFYNSSRSFIQDGRLRPLAVTGGRRLKELPGVPTLKEKGIIWPLEAFYMLYASPNTDPNIVLQLQLILAKRIQQDTSAYESQGIHTNLQKLNQTEKLHLATITRYETLKFPIDIKQ